MCVALRGLGPHVFQHYPSLASFGRVESRGIEGCVPGGPRESSVGWRVVARRAVCPEDQGRVRSGRESWYGGLCDRRPTERVWSVEGRVPET